MSLNNFLASSEPSSIKASPNIIEITEEIFSAVISLDRRLGEMEKRLYDTSNDASGTAQGYGSGVLPTLYQIRDVVQRAHNTLTNIDSLVGSPNAPAVSKSLGRTPLPFQ